MNFKKEQLKEVTTVDKVTDLVIFEKGDSTPKRIKKTNFDSTASSILGYTSYVALVSQAFASAPTAKVLHNDLGGTPVWGYSSQGLYTLDLADAWVADKTAIIVSQSDGTVVMSGFRDTASRLYFVSTDTATQVAVNSYYNDTLVEIRVYN
jgi:hypothetical protein